MPEFTNADRLVIMAEQSLWTCATILRAESDSLDNEFGRKIKTLSVAVLELARELQAYNDGFEVED